MNLLVGEKICKSFGDRVLFDNISFSIQEGDKIGVIGINGTGKSTLLQIIAKIQQPDIGTITTVGGMRIGYLSQNPYFMPNTTVLQQVFRGENPVMQLVLEYEQTLEKFELDTDSKEHEIYLTELSGKMDKLDAWELLREAKTILTKLGITEFDKNVSELSGGQKKRVAMAGALISPVDLLILDEPTNHIDSDMVEWLEKHLEKYSKALLMVTHDRYFLERVSNRILELDSGNLYSYDANYSKFLEMKAEREELQQSSERKRQNLFRSELEWVRRGAKARSTKQKARLQRFEEISSAKRPEERGNVEIGSIASRLGKKIIEIRDLTKSYDGVSLFKDFNYIILRDDRIGITGKNGCGKSTLLKLITKEILPDTGEVEIGDTVKIGIFAQENADMDESQTVIDYIKDIAEYLLTADGRVSASQMLENFLFPADMQRIPISFLSGGERRRLYLLKVLMSAPNVLFLDEPTNDLDIETLTILENYLRTFQGAVIAVSHDRYFLDKMANRLFVFLGDKNIKQYEGGYTDYREIYEKEFSVTEEKKIKNDKKQEPVRENRAKKMTFNEQREFLGINEKLNSLDNELRDMQNDINRITSDYVKLHELTDKKEILEKNIEEIMDRWVYLSELAEEIENNKK